MLNGKNILITGGTGSFGHKFVEMVLRDYPDINKLIVYSRSERSQVEMQQLFPENKYPQLRFFIGDVRDLNRLKRACEGVDILIHAASIGSVNTAEYNPDECIKTNVLGAQNVIDSAIQNKIEHIISLSSAKACTPTTLYGATKLTSDKLFCAANNLIGWNNIRFSVLRFPNALGQKASAYFIFKKAIDSNADFIPLTDKKMTRFNISLVEAVQAIIFSLKNQIGGEIFVPKCTSYHLTDLAKAMAPNMPTKEIGLRPNEKLHEELINRSDAQDTIDIGSCFAILPSIAFKYTREQLLEAHGSNFVPEDFCYCSQNNANWETIDTLRAKIKRYVDKNFIAK